MVAWRAAVLSLCPWIAHGRERSLDRVALSSVVAERAVQLGDEGGVRPCPPRVAHAGGGAAGVVVEVGPGAFEQVTGITVSCHWLAAPPRNTVLVTTSNSNRR